MKYLLDTNVFIEAKNRYYAFAICPGFWDWMDHIMGKGDVLSIELVRDEMLESDDDLAKWIRARKSEPWFLKQDDDATQGHFKRIAAAVQSGSYTDGAKQEFLRGADAWVVAKAKASGAAVVPLEVRDPSSKKRVPLPNVCDFEGVECVNTFEVLPRLGAAFHFRAASSAIAKGSK